MTIIKQNVRKILSQKNIYVSLRKIIIIRNYGCKESY